MKRLKIAYFGDGPWAHKSFNELIKIAEIKVVVVRNDFKDPILMQLAKDNNIDCIYHPNVNSEEFLNALKAYQCDIGVSMSFNQILKEKILNLFTYKFINCHAGKLPHYRGRNILNWALINDEKEFGITCHYIDTGIDTGDIIYQKTYPITDNDDYGTLLNRSIDECPVVLIEATKMIANGEVKPIKQPLFGSYFVQRRNGDEWIDWSNSSREVFNFVRAITLPGPCARTRVKKKGEQYEIIIRKVELIKEAPSYKCINGAIVAKGDGYICVKTGDSYIKITDFEILDTPNQNLVIGQRLF